MSVASQVRERAGETAAEQVTTALLLVDEGGRIVEAGAAAASLLGVRVGDVLEGFPDEPPPDGEWIGVAAGTATGGTIHVWARVRRLGGMLLWALEPLAGHAAPDAVRRLVSERELLAAVLRQLPVGVIIAEAPSGRMLVANEQAARILGVNELPMARSVEDYGGYVAYTRDGRALAAHDWPMARTVERGEIVTGEVLEVVRGDGSRVWVELDAAPIRDEGGRIAAGVVVFADVSAREEGERAEREFVTNAAHELQTPLAAIVSAVEVLQSGAKEEAEDRDRFLEHIQRECDRLSRLVGALLVLARAQRAGDAPPASAVAVRPLLDRIALELKPAPGIVVLVRCAPRLAVRANEHLLEQALANLAANAAKFTRAGSIRLSARRLGADRVAVEVADTGPGIPPGEERRIFARFYRGGDRDATGFGLGLAIVEQAVAALGGSVELASRRRGGTVARVVLPAAEDA